MSISWLAIRRTILAVAVMLAAMAVLWWSFWSIGAAQYRLFIDDWINGRRAAGYQVQYDSRDTYGFPRFIGLHFKNFRWKDADGITIHADDLLLSTLPWQWEMLDAKFKRGYQITIPINDKITLVTTADSAHSHTELDKKGDWSFIRLDLSNAKAQWAGNPLFDAEDLEISLARPASPSTDHTEPGLSMTTAADNFVLANDILSPFGSEIAKIDATMRLMDWVPDPRRKDQIAAWNNDGGVLEFQNLYLDWGPLLFSAKGTLGLDDDLQPEGAFVGEIGNHDEVIKALLDQNYIPKRDAGMLDSALNLFAKHGMLSDKPSIEVPITVQLGGLFLGPVRIFTFPEIEWQTTPPSSSTP